MTTIQIILLFLSSLTGVATGLAWRKIMTLQTSLDTLVSFVSEQRQSLQAAVAAIPAQVTAALDKAIADYKTAHPSDNLDGVTSASLIAAMQSITDDTRSILNNIDVIPIQIEDAQPTPEA